jgi:NADH-ubiquinone oxidoreductase chain 5
MTTQPFCGIITTYALYITLGLLALLFLVFAPVLIDTSMSYASTASGSSALPIAYGQGPSEIRLIIIYFASLIIVLIK